MVNSNQTALILGANGNIGRFAVQTFADAGWTVRAQTRENAKLITLDKNTETVSHWPLNIQDTSAMNKAADGCDVIVNALNPLYPDWEREVPIITKATLAAAKSSGATVLLPGNVYNFGPDMPPVLTEDTPQNATNTLGKVRVEMEQAYKTAANEGVQTVILRMGEFLSPHEDGNWFDTHMTGGLAKGKFAFPGNPNISRAWAYLPDSARALVALAEKRTKLDAYCDIPFPGSTLTGAEMASIIEKAMGRKIRLTSIPWWAIYLMALYNREMRGVLEMRYLWNTPHQLDGKKFNDLLPDFEFTPTKTVISNCVQRHV